MDTIDARAIACILFAISFWDKNAVNRLEIAHAADELNHASFSECKLDLVLKLLVERQLILDSEASFSITRLGRLMLGQASRDATNVYDELRALEELLNARSAV